MSTRNKIILAVLAPAGITIAAALGWIGYQASLPAQDMSAFEFQCYEESQLAEAGRNEEYPGMVWVPGGTFTMGAEGTYFEEGPAHEESVAGFWMARHEVTNAEFAEFVEDTGYKTLAERGIENPNGPPLPGSAVFTPHVSNEQINPFASWWSFMEGASWLEPKGPGSDIEGLENHPVVHIAFEDAQAYAQWKGHALPTEAQFEFAAQSSQMRSEDGTYLSNTWQGLFPLQHYPMDGFIGTAPVECFGANKYGLYDLIGNVWEWTQSPYFLNHSFPDQEKYPQGYDPNQPGEPVAVIKGGSYLCAPNYCMRYRPEARQAQSKGLGTSHIGFRTTINP